MLPSMRRIVCLTVSLCVFILLSKSSTCLTTVINSIPPLLIVDHPLSSICCETDRKRSIVVLTKISEVSEYDFCQNDYWLFSVILTAGQQLKTVIIEVDCTVAHTRTNWKIQSFNCRRPIPLLWHFFRMNLDPRSRIRSQIRSQIFQINYSKKLMET